MRESDDGRLSTLDFIVAVMDSRRRQLDFGTVLHFRKAPGLEALRAGAKSARNLYPATGSVIDGNRWTPIAVPLDGVTAATASTDAAAEFIVEEFVARRLDPRKHAPIRQLLVTGEPRGGTMLITRVHHAAADGFSVAMWLHHQFRVAYGLERPAIEPVPFEPVPVRHHSSPVRKSPLGFCGPSQRLWTGSGLPTGSRRWVTIELPAATLGARCSDSGITYPDVLVTAAIETLIGWNRIHGANSRRIGLWLPVNIRQHRSARFGNGTSRIRIYPRYSADASFADKCREIRRQIRWGLRHGEWAVPSSPAFTRLPLWLVAPLLRLYLNRPWVDMGTTAFTHAENWSGLQDGVFQDVEKIECFGQMHERHAVAMNSVRHCGKTWLTFTFDPGRWTSGDTRQFAGLYQEQIALAERALA